MNSGLCRLVGLILVTCCSACTGIRPSAVTLPVGPAIQEFGVDHSVPLMKDLVNSSQIAVLEAGKEHVLWAGDTAVTAVHSSGNSSHEDAAGAGKQRTAVRPSSKDVAPGRKPDQEKRVSVPLFCTECGLRSQCGSVVVCGNPACDRPESCPGVYSPCDPRERLLCTVTNGVFGCEAERSKPDEGS